MKIRSHMGFLPCLSLVGWGNIVVMAAIRQETKICKILAQFRAFFPNNRPKTLEVVKSPLFLFFVNYFMFWAETSHTCS